MQVLSGSSYGILKSLRVQEKQHINGLRINVNSDNWHSSAHVNKVTVAVL